MNRDVIKQIIIDQRDIYLNNTLVNRNYELEDNVNYCFVGIRRTGKSYMMYQQIQKLIDKGIPLSNIIYINFEDERLIEMTSEDLNAIIEIGLEFSKDSKPYLFFDEIQNIEGWEKFVRRIADMKYSINITGSNSKMLSCEIASTLGGRFVVVNIYPYSFSEYLKALNKEKNYLEVLSTKDKADIQSIYDDYVSYGAFPELVDIKNKRAYLRNIYQTVYLGDIITRNKLTNDFAVRLMLKKVAETITKPLSYSRLYNILKSTGLSISKQTVINYMNYICDSFLLFSIQNYHGKLVDKETNPKYYFMDSGLLSLILIDSKTKQLENLVAIELIRRYGVDNVYYYENNMEVDFYIPSEELAIQVCYEALTNEDTKDRELSSLFKLHNYLPNTKCMLISNSEETIVEYDNLTIVIIPAWKWLLLK